VATGAGRDVDAAMMLGGAEAVREEIGVELTPPARTYDEVTIARAVAAIGDSDFWTAWQDGRKLPVADVLARALGGCKAGWTPGEPVPTSTGTVDLRVHALGPLHVWVGERHVEKTDWGSSRARELLVFLAAHPEGRTKAQIGLALWPDASPAQLRNTFHVTLHRLRHALGRPEAIVAEGDGYRINPTLALDFDAATFQRDVTAALRALRSGTDVVDRLAAALALYRGDFLLNEEVGEWADDRRDQLRRLRTDGLYALGRAYMDRDRNAEAVEAFRTLLAIDPTHEDACRREMACLTQLGDRGAALRAYDGLARALRKELGVAPEPETSALRDSLLRTQPA
jgi:DNA-binding SARP family transcriptional activator